MRKFTADQMLTAFELEQMLYDFAHEIDHNGAQDVGRFYTEDGAFRTGGVNVQGRPALQGFYDNRNAAVKQHQKGGERTGRHIFTNVRVEFDGDDKATLTFVNLNYAGEGPAPVNVGQMSPSAIADGRFECARQADGQWLFTLFAPKQALIGEDDFMKLMLALNAKKDA